jgi:hypothetical protein
MSAEESPEVEFDTGHVDPWIGVPLGGGQMQDPVAPNDIRRWAQALQNPNPLYVDETYAAEGRRGRTSWVFGTDGSTQLCRIDANQRLKHPAPWGHHYKLESSRSMPHSELHREPASWRWHGSRLRRVWLALRTPIELAGSTRSRSSSSLL